MIPSIPSLFFVDSRNHAHISSGSIKGNQFPRLGTNFCSNILALEKGPLQRFHIFQQYMSIRPSIQQWCAPNFSRGTLQAKKMSGIPIRKSIRPILKVVDRWFRRSMEQASRWCHPRTPLITSCLTRLETCPTLY